MSGTTNGVNGYSDGPIPLPSAKPFNASDHVVIQPPLTRRGYGPALIILVPAGLNLDGSSKTLDPPPLQKWAEEGYAVAQITVGESSFGHELMVAFKALDRLPGCEDARKVGVICEIGVVALVASALLTGRKAIASR